MNKEELLEKAYFDPKQGYSSANALYNRLKDQGVTRKEVNQFIAKLEITQLHAKKQKPEYGTILTSKINQLWESDLIDYSQARYKNANNKSAYILVIIDNFSKKLWAYPLVNKTASGVLEHFLTLVNEQGAPKTFMTDDGSEYKGAMKKYMQENDINHVVTEHASHAERVIRTIKNKLARYFSANNTVRWKDVLPHIVENYNSSVHSTTGQKPDETKDDNEKADIYRGKQLRLAVIKDEKNKSAPLAPLKVGDEVRIATRADPFVKGYAQQWSRDIHIIKSANQGLYKVEGSNHVFKRYQLKLAGQVVRYKKPVVQRDHSVRYIVPQQALVERAPRVREPSAMRLNAIVDL